MTYSEAVESVGKLVAAFPNGSPANAKGYIGALAAVLADYPRIVAAKCVDPLKGVARDTRFLPTVADLVGWCEREIKGLREIIDRDDRQNAIKAEAKRLEDEAAGLAAARTTRPTLKQMQEKYGPNWGLGTADNAAAEAKQAHLASITHANRVTFERECKQAGIDPAGGVSPTLTKILTAGETAEARMRKAERLGARIDRLAEQAEAAE